MTTSMILPALLADTVARHLDRPAVVTHDRVLTYAEFEGATNRLARSLIRQGVHPGERVAIWLPRSIEALVSLWGVMKASAVYVPVDPNVPVARLAAIARDCAIAGLITTIDRAEVLNQEFAADPPMRTVWYADPATSPPRIAGLPAITWSETETESAEPPPLALAAEDLACIQYTSGSTGVPKGAMIPHRALFSQALGNREYFGIVPEDRMPNFAIHTGMSGFDVFGGVSAGAALFPIAPHLTAFPSALARSWSEQRITTGFVVPSLLIGLLNRGELDTLDLSSLRMVLFGGEAMPLEPLRELMRILPQTRFVNAYARTEAKTRGWHEVKFPPDEMDVRLLSKTFPQDKFLVLDESLRPVPVGETGELWLAGPCLMRGYWGLPELNANVMQTIKLSSTERVLAGRSGDLVRRLENGALELIGRIDRQIKLRGHRVELGEIETTLYRHPAVEWVAVVAEPNEGPGNRLMAIVVLKAGAQADARALRDHCAALLPPYMIPDTIEFRAQPALNSGGKADRRALLGPSGSSSA
jgi:amino acid adenylation domain-containing protein